MATTLPTVNTIPGTQILSVSRPVINSNFAALSAQSTASIAGLIQIASGAEVAAGTDTEKAIVPSTLKSRIDVVSGDVISLENRLSADINDLENAVGTHTGLVGLNYSSTYYLANNTPLSSALGTLDTATNEISSTFAIVDDHTAEGDTQKTWSANKINEYVMSESRKNITASDNGKLLYAKYSAGDGYQFNYGGLDDAYESNLKHAYTFNTPPLIILGEDAMGIADLGINGGVTLGTGKNSGDAVFNGTDGYFDHSSDSMVFGTSATFSVWFKPTSIEQIHPIFVGRLASPSTNSYLEFNINASNKLGVTVNGTSYGPGTISINNTAAWYHIVVVLDDTGGVKTYVNNVLDINDSTPLPSSLASIKNCYVGYDSDASLYAKMQLDELYIWNTCISAVDIAKIYYNGTGRFLDSSIKQEYAIGGYELDDFNFLYSAIGSEWKAHTDQVWVSQLSGSDVSGRVGSPVYPFATATCAIFATGINSQNDIPQTVIVNLIPYFNGNAIAGTNIIALSAENVTLSALYSGITANSRKRKIIIFDNTHKTSIPTTDAYSLLCETPPLIKDCTFFIECTATNAQTYSIPTMIFRNAWFNSNSISGQCFNNNSRASFNFDNCVITSLSMDSTQSTGRTYLTFNGSNTIAVVPYMQRGNYSDITFEYGYSNLYTTFDPLTNVNVSGYFSLKPYYTRQGDKFAASNFANPIHNQDLATVNYLKQCLSGFYNSSLEYTILPKPIFIAATDDGSGTNTEYINFLLSGSDVAALSFNIDLTNTASGFVDSNIKSLNAFAYSAVDIDTISGNCILAQISGKWNIIYSNYAADTTSDKHNGSYTNIPIISGSNNLNIVMNVNPDNSNTGTNPIPTQSLTTPIASLSINAVSAAAYSELIIYGYWYEKRTSINFFI